VAGDEVLDPDITISTLSTVPNTINNNLEHECLNEAVRMLNAQLIRQSTDDSIPGPKYSI
jgi:hypothetical protein